MKSLILTLSLLLASTAFAKVTCKDFADQLDRGSGVITVPFQSFAKLAKAGKATEKQMRLIKRGAGWEYYRDLLEPEMKQKYNLNTLKGFSAFLVNEVFAGSFDDVEFRRIKVAGVLLDEVVSFHGAGDFHYSNFYLAGTETSIGLVIGDDSCYKENRR